MFVSRYRKQRDERGDTIVEVLISIAIVSLVLVAAFTTANRNGQVNQDTKEHGQAQKLVESQLEFLRGAGGLVGGQCFSPAGAPTGSCTTADPQQYVLKVVNNGGTYQASATWNSLTGNVNTVTMYYRPV